jgi:hypothetical protein
VVHAEAEAPTSIHPRPDRGDLAANNNAKLVPHLSPKVELTGDVAERVAP